MDSKEAKVLVHFLANEFNRRYPYTFGGTSIESLLVHDACHAILHAPPDDAGEALVRSFQLFTGIETVLAFGHMWADKNDWIVLFIDHILRTTWRSERSQPDLPRRVEKFFQPEYPMDVKSFDRNSPDLETYAAFLEDLTSNSTGFMVLDSSRGMPSFSYRPGGKK